MKIKTFKISWVWLVLGLVIGLYALVLSYYSIRRHEAFASSYDLANMDQVMWQTVNGKIFQLTGKSGLTSRFDFHADIILVLSAPLYLIWNDVRVLLIIQAVGLALAVIPIYLIANKILKNKLVALLVCGSYMVNPGLLWTNMYDFHPIALAIPLLLTGFYFWLERDWKWMWVFFMLAMMTKENVGLWVMMLGMVTVCYHKNWKNGLLIGAVGLSGFLLTVFIITPNSGQTGTHWAWQWYSMPENIFKIVFDKEAINYYVLLTKPLLFLPLLGLPWLVLAGPEMAINLLSSQGQMKGITMHYDVVPLLTIMVAVIFGLAFIKKYIKSPGMIIVAGLMFLMAVKQSYNLSPLPYTPSYWRPMYAITNDEIEFDKYLKTIPKQAITTASSEVRPHINHRNLSFNLDNGVNEAEYILMVDQNRLVGDYETKPFEGELIKKLRIDPGYKLDFQQGHFWGFRKI